LRKVRATFFLGSSGDASSDITTGPETLWPNQPLSIPKFDQTQGAVSSSTSRMQIAGPLTLVINGMELPGKVDLTIEESTKRLK